MIIPIRCFTCGKEISSAWEPYVDAVKKNKSECEALDDLGLRRICCRRMLLSHVDIIGKMLELEMLKDTL